MAISVDLPIEHLHEPVVSCDTALSCLLRVGVGKREDPEFEEFRRRAVLDGNTLPASRLIELVGKLGLQAKCMRFDWNGLTRSELGHPILVFLKNTNAVVVTGTEGPGAEAVSVWDLLHSDSEALTVRREDFERAWSGDALTIVPRSSAEPEALSGSSCEQTSEVPDLSPETGSECAPIAETELPSGRVPVARAKARQLGGIGVLAAAALTVPLWLHAITDNVGTARIRSDERSSEAPQTTEEPAVHSLMPVVATGAATRPMPAGAPSIATPTMPPSGRTAVVQPATATPMPEAAPALTGPAPAEPPAGPTVGAGPAAAIPSPDVAAAATRPTDSPPAAESGSPGPEIVALLARGDVLFSTGDLAAARTFYERAADAGEAQAALRLGESYDPIFLEHAHLRGVRGNVETARSWYRRARDLGATEAEILLNSLQAQ